MKVAFFPLGELKSDKDNDAGNLWRETEFALNLIQTAVKPVLKIGESIRRWKNIQKKLSENKRNRESYTENVLF